VTAITAEPGGSEAVRQRLTECDVPPLDYEVVSDPEHEYLKGKPDMFVLKDHDWEVSGPYRLVQPALVVYEDDDIISKWSWKTMGFESGTPVDDGSGSMVKLVTFRPVMSDLLPSSKRDVRSSWRLSTRRSKLENCIVLMRMRHILRMTRTLPVL